MDLVEIFDSCLARLNRSGNENHYSTSDVMNIGGCDPNGRRERSLSPEVC